ncbi:MAG: DUF4160 domain-containing protein [Thermodesulfovibrionales bacterium]|nr:DUF4160 domain-containing protein [Thermodesulfovibrionales bacterium]
MPRISFFFGIVIYMYYDDHNPPHFHVSYEGAEAMFDFDGNIIKGFIAARAQGLIKEWCSLHKKELEENWQRAKEDKSLNWIEPLR